MESTHHTSTCATHTSFPFLSVCARDRVVSVHISAPHSFVTSTTCTCVAQVACKTARAHKTYRQNQRVKLRGQRTLGDCWQWKADGQCSKGDKCSFRQNFNKRAKLTLPNLSPSSFMWQNERKASRTRSPRR